MKTQLNIDKEVYFLYRKRSGCPRTREFTCFPGNAGDHCESTSHHSVGLICLVFDLNEQLKFHICYSFSSSSFHLITDSTRKYDILHLICQSYPPRSAAVEPFSFMETPGSTMQLCTNLTSLCCYSFLSALGTHRDHSRGCAVHTRASGYSSVKSFFPGHTNLLVFLNFWFFI